MLNKKAVHDETDGRELCDDGHRGAADVYDAIGVQFRWPCQLHATASVCASVGGAKYCVGISTPDIKYVTRLFTSMWLSLGACVFV